MHVAKRRQGRARSAQTVAVDRTSKGVSARLSRWEFKLCRRIRTLRPQLERRLIVDIVVAQMIVTGVLLFGFSVEVLLNHLQAK